MNIAVFMGGISKERNVSFASGKAVAEALLAKGHSVVAIDPALGKHGVIDLANFTPNAGVEPSSAELAAFPPSNLVECVYSPLLDGIDVVFLALHGKYGEDGYIQSLLDLRGVRYTGSKMLSSTIAMSKLLSKRIFQSVGISTPAFVTVTPEQAREMELLEEIRDTLGHEMVVKPDGEGSTVGISIILDGNLDDLARAITLAAEFSRTILVEEFIEGRELTVGVVGDETLPIIEIRTDSGFYDYAHKYTKGRTEYICPAELPDDVEHFVTQLALDAHNALECKGYSRVDFRLNDEYQAYCLEVNTLPGMTGTSLVPKAAAAADMDFGELCERIIELA
jgi:D-alanine-D-alanine ligase